MTSKLVQMQARFQQRQMQEKEEKLLKLYETQQQRAFDKIGRSSAGSNNDSFAAAPTGGKVRQMFDERRQKAGIDKSYPLEPLRSKNNARIANLERKTSITSTVKTSSVSKNGKGLIRKKEVHENVNRKESFEESKRVEDGDNVNNSKSYREIIEMLDNNNLTDNLENEKMPQLNLDENDTNFEDDNLGNKNNNIINNNSIAKKFQPKTTIDIKRESPSSKKNNPTKDKRTPIKPTPPSPRNSIPNSPAKISNKVMHDKTKSTVPRAPSSTRPSAKQQSPRSVVNRDDLTECTYCGRRFAEDRIQKHEDICSKTGKKKRKAYDATKHRVLGTELESYILRGPKGKANNNNKLSSRNLPKKDWRRTHEEFIAAIRAAKEAQVHLSKGGKLSDLPPPPPSSNPDYVQCPHCGRRFNAAAAERHIPKCADYQFNKPKPGATAKGKTNNKR